MVASTPPSESVSNLSTHDVEAAAEQLSLWQRLTEPHESIHEVGERHLARLLSSFLIIVLVVACIGVPVMGTVSWAAVAVLGMATVSFAVAYLLSRTRRYRLGVVITMLTFILGPNLATHIGPLPLGIALSHQGWVITAVLLGCLYLSTRVMLLVVLLCVAGAVILYGLMPGVSVEGVLTVVWYLVAMSAMILAINHYRDAIEKERIAVEQRRDELAKLNRSMETMIYVISHDLKEPLRAIQNFSQMVDKRYSEKLDDKGKDFLRRVVRGAKRMRVLLDDLLQLSRAQRIEQTTVAVPGAEIVAAALGRLEEVIERSGAEIQVADDLPGFRIDPSWASGAVYNLVENAIKYTPDGATPEIAIAGYRGSRGIGLVVKDRGPGVEVEHRERIFALFQRAVSRDVPGTGAGLAIVRQIAERHGGTAWVEPRSRGGSAFFITFRGAGQGTGPRGATSSNTR